MGECEIGIRGWLFVWCFATSRLRCCSLTLISPDSSYGQAHVTRPMTRSCPANAANRPTSNQSRLHLAMHCGNGLTNT
jgi:V8-like Glu-specific endopeptidase